MSFSKQSLGRFLWLSIICVGLWAYIRYPELFRAEGLAEFLTQYHEQALWMYLFVSLLRGFFLIPSTPFVLAGVLLFPKNMFWVFVISMLGVMFGSCIVYFFSEQLGFGESLRHKHEKLYHKLQDKMKRFGFPIVILWSFFPLVPTDLICCIAGTIRMSFYKFLLALFIGECFLILGYMYSGKALLYFLFS